MKQLSCSLKQWLLEHYDAPDHELPAAWPETAQEALLPPPESRADCALVLQVCLPYLETLCTAPEEGWLMFLYEELTQRLYPEPGRTETTPERARAADFYLCVLHWVIGRERCAFDPLTDIDDATEEEVVRSRIPEEYSRFCEAVEASHFVELLRIGRSIMPFDPASHTIGVHHVAVHMARQAVRAGIPIDIALVSAASLTHDIGKFGCRGENARRIPYLHYYYTWQWLEEHALPTIANVAANHSTWDLEFENLPGESLLLIYADFRVRGRKDEDGKEHVRIFSLAEAYTLIFSKLSDMTPEKQKRYRTVYAKLHDFEHYLVSNGISPDPIREGSCVPERVRPALLPRSKAPAEFWNQTFSNNIKLMRQISFDASFEQLLEQARNEKNLQSIRTYLTLYAEYYTYLTRDQKRKLLAFLYELLMHHDGDVRRRAAKIMGQILSNSGPKYRKELPAGVPEDAAPNLLSFLNESLQVWETYVNICLHPDLKITPKHAQRISNSLKIIAENVFLSLQEEKWPEYLQVLLAQLRRGEPSDRFVLIDTLSHVPTRAFLPHDAMELAGMLELTLRDATQVEALGVLTMCRKMLCMGDEAAEAARKLAEMVDGTDSQAVLYEKQRILRKPGELISLTNTQRQQLFLSDMETAVHWTVKLSHIDMLCENAKMHPEQMFHTAMHLSNLLCVSEHLPVRAHAGECLVELSGLLPTDQQNELMIDLIRELETGRDEVSRYIPANLGKMLCRLPAHEFAEGMQALEELVRSDNNRAATSALATLAAVLTDRSDDSRVAGWASGLLMTGVAHYDDRIHQTALSLLCRRVFDEPGVPLAVRRTYFNRICKKLLTLLEEPHPGQLSFFTRAAALNRLYRFAVQCRVELPAAAAVPENPIAFFPGTFDPFSSGHKRIIEEIRKLGFDVYLAIDEFSWSKQTLPKLLRRQIASISSADQLDVYLFPDDIPVNIAMAEDLNALRHLLPSRKVYLAVGSDVVRNASAYRLDKPGSAADFNHIVFYREEMEQPELPPLREKLHGELQIVKLPRFFENVSSTRIREYVDKNMDISMLVDPIVQNLIYQRGLYLRAPQYKQVLPLHKLYYTDREALPEELPARLQGEMKGWKKVCSVTLRSRAGGKLWGWAFGYTVLTSQLLDALGDIEAAACVRKRVSGNIVMIGGAQAYAPDPNVIRMVLCELLARAQEKGHTFALCRPDSREMAAALEELGFLPVPEHREIWSVDMRSPVVLIQDALQCLKTPHRDDPEVIAVVNRARTALRKAFAAMFPGCLLLSFNTELLNQALRSRVQRCNGVDGLPDGVRQLGEKMCVPFGRILANDLVPNTVTKRLESEKEFTPDTRDFEIKEYPGYSTLPNQVRTIKSFRRPVILVDDLLHNGYRLERLDPLLKQEGVKVDRIIVGVMSGKGKDLLQAQNRRVECEYFVPNLRYWQTESLLYPFIGGDSVKTSRKTEMLPAVNLVLPYNYPRFFADAEERAIYELSRTVLENARDILLVLERRHLDNFGKSLTLKRLGEAIVRPRMPDRGGHLSYDLNIPASAYVMDDLTALRRMQKRRGTE